MLPIRYALSMLTIALTLVIGCSPNTAEVKTISPAKTISAAEVRELTNNQTNIAALESNLDDALAKRQLTLTNVTASLIVRNAEGSLVIIDKNSSIESVTVLHFEIPESKKDLIRNVPEGSTVTVKCKYYGAGYQNNRLRVWFDVIDISK